jgi:tRNA (guanine-N7-)-methyltransferase
MNETATEHTGATALPGPSPSHPFWRAIFGTDGAVEIEIGSGDGTFLLAAAARDPATNFFGIERSRAKARRLAARVAHAAIPNVRTLHADAACVVRLLVPPSSVVAYHLYFPDPWPKRRHAARRILTDDLLEALARSLVDGGRLLLASDVYGYLRLMRTHVRAHGVFDEHDEGVDHPGLTTGFARKYRAAGRSVYAATFVRRVRPVVDH